MTQLTVPRAAVGRPPERAILTMARQIGLVLGVGVVVALVGTPHSYASAHGSFVHGWWMTAGVLVVAAVACLGMPIRLVRDERK